MPSAVLTSPSVERVREALSRAGLADTIGGVAPVGHGLTRTFIEKSLAPYPELWAAAGHPHTVFRLSYGSLVRITGGDELELA
jgi:prolyl-tRNA editing enzyme YbaK/EbsC (Cys-tRNA(Pro) deacylase)